MWKVVKFLLIVILALLMPEVGFWSEELFGYSAYGILVSSLVIGMIVWLDMRFSKSTTYFILVNPGMDAPSMVFVGPFKSEDARNIFWEHWRRSFGINESSGIQLPWVNWDRLPASRFIIHPKRFIGISLPSSQEGGDHSD